MSLLEVAFTIAIVGSLLAVLVPAFMRSLVTSKTSEAVQTLAELHARSAAYFDQAHAVDGVSRRWCLPEEAGPTPRFPSADRVRFDFQAETVPGHETWKVLGFQPGPIRFRYSFVPEGTGCGLRRAAHAPVLTLVAEGDLDQDGTLSSYERSASVDIEGRLVPEGALRVQAGIE